MDVAIGAWLLAGSLWPWARVDVNKPRQAVVSKSKPSKLGVLARVAVAWLLAGSPTGCGSGRWSQIGSSPAVPVIFHFF